VATRVSDDEVLDVRQAAAIAGRSAETIRRWVWSGRLPARKVGRKLIIAKNDLEAIRSSDGERRMTLAEWYHEYIEKRPRSARPGRSAADLVFEDRRQHYGDDWFDARH
jgi:excisionase family DNA binding protein